MKWFVHSSFTGSGSGGITELPAPEARNRFNSLRFARDSCLQLVGIKISSNLSVPSSLFPLSDSFATASAESLSKVSSTCPALQPSRTKGCKARQLAGRLQVRDFRYKSNCKPMQKMPNLAPCKRYHLVRKEIHASLFVVHLRSQHAGV